MSRFVLPFAAACLLGSAAIASAQAPPARPDAPATPAAEPAPAPAPEPAETTAPAPVTVPGETEEEPDTNPGSYDPQGRRDPFRPLTGEAADTELRAKYEHTLRGRLLQEVKLTSIVKTPKGSIATFEGGPNKEGYFARVGDQLWDGTVVDIDFDKMTVTVRQKLDDPRLIKDYRDVPIPLFSEEEMAAQNGPAGRGAPPPPQ